MASLNTKYARDVMHAVMPIVIGAGASCRLDPAGNKHGRLVVIFNGRERFSPLSSSPRCAEEAIRCKIGDVRRLLRELGA